jgi:hypothetical protein
MVRAERRHKMSRLAERPCNNTFVLVFWLEWLRSRTLPVLMSVQKPVKYTLHPASLLNA